jgi:metal-responsive CopG/Arc/MetJ family transcriptional regulator
MKTAVSIPEDVFHKADRLARRSKKSRSQLYSEALREYIARHSEDEITEAMNRAIDEIGEKSDSRFIDAAAAQALQRIEW